MFIVKIPSINGLGKTQGCELAGNAIINTLKEVHSNEQGVPIDIKLFDLEEIHVDNSNIEVSCKLIYNNSFKMFEVQPKIIFIGGDHSISFSTGNAFLNYCKKENKEPCLVVFDAHADCMEPMKEPTHEEWLRALVEKGFPSKNILLVGVRNIWKDEILFLKKNNIKFVKMDQFLNDFEDTCDLIMEFTKDKEVYISIDVDVIDPAFAPATGYPESGGLSSRQFLYILHRLNKIKNIRAVDIVEINPEKDKNNMTVKLGAKIIGEMI